MEITYDYYRIFYYAAKYKSFSKAAEILMSCLLYTSVLQVEHSQHFWRLWKKDR